MKTRESGMPEEAVWAGFFDPNEALARLGMTAAMRDAVEFGCGYGTFTLPAACLIRGVVHALDIDPQMVAHTQRKAQAASLTGVRAQARDCVADGTGLPDGSCDYAMLFNILHAECPEIFLRESWRVLHPGGLLGIMHWNLDAATPRGPSMAIRPRPEQCRQWALDAGFVPDANYPDRVDLPPYHYGWVMRRP